MKPVELNMYCKVAIACLDGLGAAVNADPNSQFGINSCPIAYALTAYVVTVVKDSNYRGQGLRDLACL